MYLLDTNVVSELRKMDAGRANARVLDWATRTSLFDMYLSAITLFETQRGILLVERRDKAQARALRAWFENQVMTTFRDRILPVDERVALRAAEFHVPDPRPERDALIAATAVVHGMTVVSRDQGDFERIGVAVLNPWAT